MTDTQSEINRLAGTTHSTQYMLLDNTLIEKYQFEDWCEKGYFPKRIAKAGWKPTHIETYTLVKDRATFYPFEEVLRKSNVKLEEIK